VHDGIQKWSVSFAASVVADSAGPSEDIHEQTSAGLARSITLANVSAPVQAMTSLFGLHSFELSDSGQHRHRYRLSLSGTQG
jgi:hypothetical protein